MTTRPSEYATQRYRIQDIAKDFQLADVREMPITGAECQFDEFLTLLKRASGQHNGNVSTKSESRFTTRLFSVRVWMGRVFRWDRLFNELPIPGCTEVSLRDRIAPSGRAELHPKSNSPFPLRPIYQDRYDAALELSNRTAHVVLHCAWVPEGDRFRAHMALYVKTRGWFGRAYVAATTPVRKYIVYPLIMKQLAKQWRRRQPVDE